MKLCFIADVSSIHGWRWARYFVNSGHEVHLISSERPQGVVINGAKLHVLNQVPFRPKILSSVINLAFGAIQVRKLLKEIRPDILHAHYITDNGVMAAMTRFHPLVLSPWGSDVLIDPKRFILFIPFIKYALNKADLVFCNSETLKEVTLKLGTSESKVRNAVFGVDTQQFSPEKRDEGLKTKLGISGAPTVISIRGLDPVYNVEMFIRAMPLVLNEMPETRFIIGGIGKQEKYLHNLANSLGVSGTIRFTGLIPPDEMPKYLASSDVYVSTSISDSTALSQKEAMACELPPVVTEIRGNQELITEGENGFFVPVGDCGMLAMKIVYLLKNKEIREKVGKAGRKLIMESAEYRTEMAKAERIYKELLGI